MIAFGSVKSEGGVGDEERGSVSANYGSENTVTLEYREESTASDGSSSSSSGDQGESATASSFSTIARTTTSQKARNLSELYVQCRLLADRLRVHYWSHHLLHFNKLTDGLAKLAKDTRSSIQIFAGNLPRFPQR